jgi:hypothetical protein
MKKYFYFIFIAFLAIGFVSCGIYTTARTNRWLEYELPPSRIIKNGKVFFEGRLSDGSMFSVFADEKIDDDARYYYVMLQQDFGWIFTNDETWTASQGAREKKYGHIYINPGRRVAVYFYPDRTFSAFKVNINQ